MRVRARRPWSATVGDWRKGETITSAPLYYDGLVITGLSGGEFGIRGSVTAYDAGTGKLAWRFYTIPGPGETGHDTWPQNNDAWKHGGAPVWQTPAVDPKLGLLYFSTGNTSPDFDGSSRKGDNLFANSIVAVDAKTGEYRWHYQQVHHDIWDLDSPSPVVPLRPEGRRAASARSRRSEQDGMGLHPRQNERQASRGNRREGRAAGAASAHGRDAAVPGRRCVHPPVDHGRRSRAADQGSRGRGTEGRRREQLGTPKWNYLNEGRIFTPFWGQTGVISRPSTIGGTNWPPSSYNPETGYLYVCSADAISIFTSTETTYQPADIRKGNDFLGSAFNAPDGNVVRGTFTAMDMRTNKIAWQKQWDHSCYSGSVTTAGGLVFVGHNDGRLIAYDARNGGQLWEFQTGAGANATATVFEHKGKQYVMLVSAGSSLGGTRLTATVSGSSAWTASSAPHRRRRRLTVRPKSRSLHRRSAAQQSRW